MMHRHFVPENGVGRFVADRQYSAQPTQTAAVTILVTHLAYIERITLQAVFLFLFPLHLRLYTVALEFYRCSCRARSCSLFLDAVNCPPLPSVVAMQCACGLSRDNAVAVRIIVLSVKSVVEVVRYGASRGVDSPTCRIVITAHCGRVEENTRSSVERDCTQQRHMHLSLYYRKIIEKE